METEIHGVKLVSIQGGTFHMGSDSGESNEQPIHEVTLSSFEMSIYEITQYQYQSVIGSNPSHFKGNDNLPVDMVSWWDAIKFCNALSMETGLGKCYNESTGDCDFIMNGFRLPTEAEWEYSCRAETSTEFNLGNNERDLAKAGWYFSKSGSKTHTVGGKTPNAWGLYDMHGNVWEWCNDWYGEYSSESQTDPTGPQTGSHRILRGGSWNNNASNCRSTPRSNSTPTYERDSVGFRIVRRTR